MSLKEPRLVSTQHSSSESHRVLISVLLQSGTPAPITGHTSPPPSLHCPARGGRATPNNAQANHPKPGQPKYDPSTFKHHQVGRNPNPRIRDQNPGLLRQNGTGGHFSSGTPLKMSGSFIMSDIGLGDISKFKVFEDRKNKKKLKRRCNVFLGDRHNLPLALCK